MICATDILLKHLTYEQRECISDAWSGSLFTGTYRRYHFSEHFPSFNLFRHYCPNYEKKQALWKTAKSKELRVDSEKKNFGDRTEPQRELPGPIMTSDILPSALHLIYPG